MKCGDIEWQHCQKEKLGCEGCFYNDEIRVGEFVRTIDGHLGKVVHKTEYFIMFDNNYNFQYRDTVRDFKLIAKHSFDIIDLIQVRRLCKWRPSC